MSYIDLMKEKARADKKTIVLPETNDKRTLIAAANILKEGMADIMMVPAGWRLSWMALRLLIRRQQTSWTDM